MGRQFSETTLLVLQSIPPLASAKDVLQRMQDTCAENITIKEVDNALASGRRAGWLARLKAGRFSDKVWRYVHSSRGLDEIHRRCGMPVSWAHSADGIHTLAGKLELVEMAYSVLPRLWESNLVNRSSCYVYQNLLGAVLRNGVFYEHSTVELRERDWSGGRLRELLWLENDPVSAIAIYDDGHDKDTRLYLPILWRTDYQEPADTAALMQCMRKHLVRDQRWLDLRREQADDVGYRPGAIVFSPGRVSGAMAYRHWEGSLQRDNITTIGIMDAEGHVVRQMGPPTASWNALKPPAFTGRVGDIEGVVAGLKTGAYAAVNGRCEWRVFRSMDRAPSVLKEHISASARVNPKIAKDLLKPMEEAGVITSWRGGHYLSEAGRALVTASQGALQSRVDKRLDVYDRPESKHRSRNRIHNEGQAYALMYLDDHGHVAFPALGSVIEYIVDGRRLRVDPDGYVVLEPGVLVALEFERSSLSKDQILEKIGKPKPDLRRVGAVRYGGYKGLADFGRPVPGLVITETDEAARRVAELRCPYILAASLDAVRRGPHGRAVTDSVADASPGCWWYWRPGEARPSNDAPIDLLSRMYVRDYPQGVWRLPFDRPFAAEPIQHTGG